MQIEVVHAAWGMGETVLAGGTHDDVEVNPGTAALLAGAESAGAIRILDATDDERALLDGHVESQEDGEAAYEAAVADGRWAEGQAVEHAAEEADLAAYQALEAAEEGES